jgi:hypothetical protein
MSQFITSEQLFDRLKGKQLLECHDLLRIVEEEFGVVVRVEKQEDELDVNALANDPDLIRQVRASREARKAGRTFNEQKGLEFLRRHSREIERESNV